MDLTRTQAEITSLQSSPLFHLSLGSRELFHSNFLEWVITNYPKEAGKVFSKFLKKRNGDTEIERVEREFKNRDLTLYFKNGEELVIENKVKSLPYKEQLDAYSKNARPNQNFLLLTLVPPSFKKRGGIYVSGTRWKVLKYSQLVVFIEQIRLQVKDAYKRAILEDYIHVATSLSALFTDIEVRKNDRFTFSRWDLDKQFRALGDIRMANLYHKLKYEMLARLILKELQKKFPKLKVHWNEKEGEPEQNEMTNIYASTGMTRATGIANAYVSFGEGKGLCLQIQGDKYRHILRWPNKSSKPVAEKLKKMNLYFDFFHIYKDPEVFPRPNRKSDFNKYEHHLYQCVKLDPNFTVRKVLGFVVTDIEKILKNKKNIEQVMRSAG